MNRSNLLSFLLGVAVAAIVALLCQKCSKHSPIPPEIIVNTVTDTLYVRDTITVKKPVYSEKIVVARDTFYLHDTVFFALDREQVEWRDSLSTVWASGVRPSVDSVRHYVTERVITNTVTETVTVPVVKRTRWGLGLQAGYGFSPTGAQPYVGVGISYNVLAW